MKRLTDGELEALLDDIESYRVERKQSFKGDVPKKAREAVCGFSNDLPNHNLPGVLFIGANDNGSPSGEPITDELLRNLSEIKTDGNILPPPVLSVEKRILKNSEIAVVTVIPSDSPPVKYKGRIWVRTGPRNSVANAQEERILNEKRRYKNIPFDIHPVVGSQLTDFSKNLFENEYLPVAFAPDILEVNNRSYQERLASTKMIFSLDNPIPTILGLLTIGTRAQDFIPGAYIQFLRINGKNLEDPVLDEVTAGGTIVEMLRRIEEKIQAHNRTAYDIASAPTHSVTITYPQVAIQQILYNAVLHRTYENTNAPVRVYWFDDRIEINSPGGPYGNVTTENFGKPGITDYRNPNIASMLKSFGYVQAFGRGIAIAQGAMKKNGNPPIEFATNPGIVIATLRGKT